MSKYLRKQCSAAFLLAGTAIGSGMISLPMVLAKWGIIGTCVMMLTLAAFTYLTALIRADLNLHTRSEASLKDAGEALGVPWVGRVGDAMLQLLSFALLAAYLSAGSSVLCEALQQTVPKPVVMVGCSCALVGFFLLASDIIVDVNKGLFIGLFGGLFFLVGVLFWQVPMKRLPPGEGGPSFQDWATLIPILFTAFGFQGSVRSVTKFCQNDRHMIQRACLWGSMITALVYTTWTVAILIVTANTDGAFFQRMLAGQATDVGELVRVLSQATSATFVKRGIWCISSLAVLTSILGVGVALLDHFRSMKGIPVWGATLITVFTPTLVALLTPNAFIRILNISGIILAIMAILVPCTLDLRLRRIKPPPLHFSFVKRQWMVHATLLCGVGICWLGFLELRP